MLVDGGPLSTIAAPFRLRLTAAQTGIDPRTHYWFKAGPDDYQRLCDNTPWTRRRRPSVFYNVCWRCYGMRQDDQERGFRAFSLTHRQTGVFSRDPEDTRELDEGMMRPLSMLAFGKFYALDKAGRKKHFADRKRSGSGPGGPPYYLAPGEGIWASIIGRQATSTSWTAATRH